ncbi:MAG: hypothetical protein KTR31_21440 [Myxococcales bacterium]|nr:hypothetical protein [Myxococcales bacterium]
MSCLSHVALPFGSTPVAWLCVVLSATGCGLFEDPGNQSNLEACEDYVAYMNTLTPCMGISYTADNLCAGVLHTKEDLQPFYSCVRENSKCDGDVPVLDLDGCTMPTASAGPSLQ